MTLFDIINFTGKQQVMACAIARGITRNRMENDIGISTAFITKCKKDKRFLDLVNLFKLLPYDEDTKEYKGLSTLVMDVSRLMYNMAEKEQNVK